MALVSGPFLPVGLGTFRGLSTVQTGKALTALKGMEALVRAYLSSTR
jgi:hypothetical protein